MIRLHLNPSIVKHLNFNEQDKMLEIEFKHHIKVAKYFNIPLSILHDYIESLKEESAEQSNDAHQSNLKIVYSNFKAS
ncbi:hypothetical protein WJN01_06850 [Flavobacteriaceae bacterium SZ-1-7]|uniref:hypothetical protein n=1 Tax=Tamlana sedimenti TaxID=3134126 RepID=UPI00312AD637